jgi:hypothetical protein
VRLCIDSLLKCSAPQTKQARPQTLAKPVLSKHPLHHHCRRTLARLEHVGNDDEHGLRRAECTRQTHDRVRSHDHPEHVPLGGSGGLVVVQN